MPVARTVSELCWCRDAATFELYLAHCGTGDESSAADLSESVVALTGLMLPLIVCLADMDSQMAFKRCGSEAVRCQFLL